MLQQIILCAFWEQIYFKFRSITSANKMYLTVDCHFNQVQAVKNTLFVKQVGTTKQALTCYAKLRMAKNT